MKEPAIVQIHVFHTASLCQTEINEMIMFAKKVSCIDDQYLLDRFTTYEQVICYKRNKRLLSFQLIQQFKQNDDVYVYFGPLFSTLNGYLPMFISFFYEVLQLHKEKKIYLAAEIQNPEILLMFKALFGPYSFPHLNTGAIPEDIRNIAFTFADHLPHMKNIDVDHLSTAATETLYRGTTRYEIIEQWLRARGINFAAGQSQVLIVPIQSDEAGRRTLVEQLQKGLALTKHWKHGKQIILQQFQEGLLNV